MKYIDENDIDKIDNNLWIGNYQGANNYDLLKKNNINVIINLYKNELNKYNGIKYYHLPYKFDEISYRDSWNIINKLLNIINKHKNDNLLINCKAGHHRSANAIILYLINKFYNNYDDTKKYVKNIRKHSLDRDSNMTTAMREYGNMVYYLYN
jgi:protein-tyrosine phosphatase